MPPDHLPKRTILARSGLDDPEPQIPHAPNGLGNDLSPTQYAVVKIPGYSPKSWISAFALLLFTLPSGASTWHFSLAYAPGPPDNPLKGLVPYAGNATNRFPHSMEFSYLPLDKVVVGHKQYDWTLLDHLLRDVSGRGHQTIFRFYMEYPGKAPAIPGYLRQEGVKYHNWTFGGKHPITTPEYADPRVREMLTDFITALGRRHDGDPRIGFIHAGLLGLWGEWHNWPREELFAPKPTQIAVLDAYEKSFPNTRVLLRYPAGPSNPDHAANSTRPFGYHDDSFAWATSDTGLRKDSWFFVPLLRAAEAENKWRSQPIGGEIRPEAWGKVFDDEPDDKRIQDFTDCVFATHASWLMDSGMFRVPLDKQPAARLANALSSAATLGYDLHVRIARVRLDAERALSLSLEVDNRGVAPFYEPWSVDFALLDATDTVRMLPSRTRLAGIQPAADPTVWNEKWRIRKLPRGWYTLLVRGRNPMPGGLPVRFANKTQNLHKDGWLSLGRIRL